LTSSSTNRLRVAAIDFLNPAPLMWDFEHSPRNTELEQRYAIHRTHPAQCASELNSGRADLGLIPIAALTPELAIVPGCTIASLDCVRSIQLIVRLDAGVFAPEGEPDIATADELLRRVRIVAADTASRSSVAYAELLLRKFAGTTPRFLPASAEPLSMLRHADAALVIGDPALLALEHRAAIEAEIGPCCWIDVAHQWRLRTGLPWVAAVWAARFEGLAQARLSTAALVEDLTHSRDAGLQHVDALVEEWTPRIAVPPHVIHEYLTRNIHYVLSDECIATIELFRRYAAEEGILPALPALRFL
jgi:chorismate dehydratase